MDPDAIFPDPKSPTGRTFRPGSPAELWRILDDAFHYRGDVTLHLRSGGQIEGYVFNTEAETGCRTLQMYVQGEAAPRVIPYAEVDAVTFSGEDTASGKSWEAWMSKREHPSKT
jgi:hypothetical protein